MGFLVAKYIPGGLYGFVVSEGAGDPQRVFFHLTVFDPQGGPPPIVGEAVSVEVSELSSTDRPKARLVTRVECAVLMVGNVTRFDHNVGYGFVADDSGAVYYLHRSEMPNGEMPLVGMRVGFYAVRISLLGANKPRACHVSILERP